MKRAAFLLIFILLGSAFAAAQKTDSRYANAIQKARQFINDSLKVSGVPGTSVTVSVGGSVVWSEGFGYADLEQGVPVTPETKFRIGSVSKPLTATALGLLYEEGKINLDTLIQAYVPAFPVKKYPITLRQMAGHIAGIRHYRGQEMLLARRFHTVEEGLSIFKDDTLMFEPGTRYSYSSYAWNLISAAIEGAAKEDFLGHMNRRVFQPLGMTNTIADYSDSVISSRARWYTRDSVRHVINAPFVDNSYKWAGGGFLSTTEDLAKFGNAMLLGSLLKRTTISLMFTPQMLKDGNQTQYGIGWFVRTDKNQRRGVSHTGGSMGGTAHLLLYPEQKVVVAMLVNSDQRFIHHAPAIAEFFLNQ